MEFQMYPRWVRGQIAQDAEDESRIEREWSEANPQPAPAAPEPEDTGIPPSDVSQSSIPASDEAPQ